MLVTKKVALLEGNAHRVASAEKKVCFRHPDDGVNQYNISFGLNHLPLQTSTRPSSVLVHETVTLPGRAADLV